jgi:hypothetical protein
MPPASVVELFTGTIESFQGRLFGPAWDSGGIFVPLAAHFAIRSMAGRSREQLAAALKNKVDRLRDCCFAKSHLVGCSPGILLTLVMPI